MSEPKPDLRPEGGSPDGLGGKTWTTTRPEVATAGTSAAAWPTMAEKSELYDVPPDLLAVSPGASHATEDTMAVIARQVAAREAAAEQRGAEKAYLDVASRARANRSRYRGNGRTALDWLAAELTDRAAAVADE